MSGELGRLFVFHRGLGTDDESATDEEAGEKILFFHPHETPLALQLTAVSLVEGMIEFTRRFSPDALCESIEMEGAAYSVLEVEPNIWAVLSVSVCEGAPRPTQTVLRAVLRSAFNMYSAFHAPIQQTLEENDGMATVAAIASARKRLRKAELRQRMLETGGMEDDAEAAAEQAAAVPALRAELAALVPDSPTDRARAMLQLFLRVYLPTVDFGALHMPSGITGFNFLAVDATSFMTVSFCSNVICGQPHVRSTAILFDKHLVHSTVPQELMLTITRFLALSNPQVSGGGPGAGPAAATAADDAAAAAQEPFDPDDDDVVPPLPPPGSSSPAKSPRGRGSLLRRPSKRKGAAPAPQQHGFLTAGRGWALPGPSVAVCAPEVFDPAEQAAGAAGPRQRLLLYQQGRVTLVLVIDADAVGDALAAFCQRVADFVRPELQRVGEMLAAQHARRASAAAAAASSSGGEGYRFLYFNRMNLAFKVSGRAAAAAAAAVGEDGADVLVPPSGAALCASLSVDVLRVLDQLHARFAQLPPLNSVHESVLRSADDTWVVGRKSGDRELYLLFDAKLSSLGEVRDALDRMGASFLSNIFVH